MNDETRSSDGRGDITGRTIAGWMGAVVAGAVVLSGLVLQVDTAGAAGSGAGGGGVEKPRASECVGWVALTFDDGPVVGEGGTLAVVEVLEELKVPGTFFMLGREMKRHPEEVRAVLDARGAAGRSVIGNGTWSHPDLRGLTERQVNRQLMKTSRVYRRISGGEMGCRSGDRRTGPDPVRARACRGGCGTTGRRPAGDDRDPVDRGPAELARPDERCGRSCGGRRGRSTAGS